MANLQVQGLPYMKPQMRQILIGATINHLKISNTLARASLGVRSSIFLSRSYIDFSETSKFGET